MNAKDFVNKYLEWSDIKSIPNQLEYCLQGYIHGKAKSLGGKTLNVGCVAAILLSPKEKHDEKLPGMVINTKKQNTKLSLIDYLEKRTGLPGYKGYFKLVDFWREEDDDSDNELARRLLGINK